MTRLAWSVVEGVLVLALPCGHEVSVWWACPSGRVGRVGCTNLGCRRVVEDVVLAPRSAEETAT